MNKQQLAAKIWASANQMRSKIEANEYKDYILGFIFYKYLSDKAIHFAQKEGMSEEDIKDLSEEDSHTVNYFKENLGYFIAYNDFFSTWIELGKDFDVSNVRDALSAFSRLISPAHKKLFDGVFDTLQTGLSKLGDSTAKQTKAISDLIHLIKDIPMDGKQDYDVLGFIYEYLISMFAANAGKKAGEFYTPHEVSVLMSEIVADHLKDKTEIQIYDPTSGSGSLLINIGQCVAKHMNNQNNIKYFAQELKKNTYNLTRMNLVMRGILPNNIATRNGDTLDEDWPWFDENDPIGSYDPIYVDAVVSNPPYSQAWDSADKESDPRYARFGLAPKTKADYAFLLHDLYHIKPDGIMTIVLPHGVLFRGGEEGKIRRNLLEQNHIDAIIGLPANIFFGTGIPTVVMVLKQKRENTDVLIVDASKGFIKVGKSNKLQASDIRKIADTVIARESINKFSKVVSRDEIRKNEYNLNIPRYVDSSESAETFDIYSSMFGGIPYSEITELSKFWMAFPGLKDTLFTKTSEQHAKLNIDDVKTTITQHPDVKSFADNFENSFGNLNAFLKAELLSNMENINISKEESLLSEEIFTRLESSSLLDKYKAYQLLEDQWSGISLDLEIIQTEGFFNACTQVDPHLVMKKKAGKDQEVQDGWQGHIFPFELVQDHCLADELNNLKQQESRIAEISSELEEILDSLSEEEKESDCLNDAGDSFVNAQVVKEAKQYKIEAKKNGAFEKDSFEAKIIKTDKLIAEDKKLKKELKVDTAKLHMQTKTCIEKLTEPEVYQLLEQKWITPLVNSLNKQPSVLIDELTSKVQGLAEKYATTYADVATRIEKTQDGLAAMIDELTGNEFDMRGLKEFKSFLSADDAD
jgi:type I restriction enzyme M protein